MCACTCVFVSVCVCRVKIQSALIFEVIQLLQLWQGNCRLKHANHFNLKPIPSHLTPMYYTDMEPLSLLPFIRFSSAALGELCSEEEVGSALLSSVIKIMNLN